MLRVYRSERADLLVGALGDLLLDPIKDPMATEVIAVPTRGVERWLSQRLSHRLGAAPSGGDGICANVEFPFPGSLVGDAISIACGVDPEADPWPPDRSVWTLLELVDEHLGEKWLEPLADHLRAGSPESARNSGHLRRFATVRHLADLYDRYAVHRPDLVRGWANPTASGEVDDHWQAELWRRLRGRIGSPGPAERLETAAARIAESPELLDLPSRLSLFGLTRLPASHLRILEAIARNRDVHLFLLHPSDQLWSSVAEALDSVAVPPVARSDDPTATLGVNPLLRSWGRDSREMQLVLHAHGVTRSEHRPVPEPPGGARTLLARLQSDIRADRCPPGAPALGTEADERPVLDPDDDSLRVHSCHGHLRQVEVMRDAILHLLAADATLEPRDVIVMCPDIESFAPLIHAVFGASSGQLATGSVDEPPVEPEPGTPQIRIRLADRSIRQTNPVLGVAAQLLELAAGRVTASEVLDLAGREPVARRFLLSEQDLGQLAQWIAVTGIRWGLDAEHRRQWHLEQVRDGTFDAGLDRLLLGVAMAEEDHRLFEGVLPVDDVSSGAVELAGRFAELVARLHVAITRLEGCHPIAEWATALIEATESLALAGPHEQWQHEQLRSLLADVTEAAATAGKRSSAAIASDGARREAGALLDLSELRSLLDDRLRGRPTRANFRTGDLTICTLVPMRSVPHRVVGLLGLDDGAFPRHLVADGDDLLLADPHIGDRDARSEDRQLLLDALLAATEHLVVTYEGRDPRTNQERSPCVPIAELLDVVDRTVRPPEGSACSRARELVVVEHPLQSFDVRNFQPGELAGKGPWSFDPVGLHGARARSAPPEDPPPFLSTPLDRLDDQVVQLDSLVRFVESPVAAFCRERLGWYPHGGSDDVRDSLPVQLEALETWDIGDHLLGARLSGATPEQARAAERARGLLPPGALADAVLSPVEETVEALVAAVERTVSAAATPRSVEVNVRLPDGRSLVGTVPDVYEINRGADSERRSRIVRCLYSALGPKHRLAAWVRFLALSAAHPDREVSATTVGRGQGTAGSGPLISRASLPPLGASPDERRQLSLAQLGVLVDLYDRGMREPLPIFPKTSEAFVDALRHEEPVVARCQKRWQTTRQTRGEDLEAAHLLVLGGRRSFAELLAEPPRPDESGPGWSTERSRLGRLARRLWEPLLAHETQEHGR
ncbi:MAG TPA: exodeoxyribonuclease V subunit gamma [Acidimicrobiales bacterium]|nr:exodeoxyribonuclease V subunit gamma [Acidimicrobiales bacterium]